EQHALPEVRAQLGGQVDRGRGLSDATFLVGHDDDLGLTIVALLTEKRSEVTLSNPVELANLDPFELAVLDIPSDGILMQLQPARNILNCEPIVVVIVVHGGRLSCKVHIAILPYNITTLSVIYGQSQVAI